MSKFNNPKNIIKCAQNRGCTHVQCVSNHIKFEYEERKTAGVTDYTNHTRLAFQVDKKSKFNRPNK